MLSYTLRRILTSLPLVVAISFVIFWIMWLAPTNFSIDDSLGHLDVAPDAPAPHFFAEQPPVAAATTSSGDA